VAQRSGRGSAERAWLSGMGIAAPVFSLITSYNNNNINLPLMMVKTNHSTLHTVCLCVSLSVCVYRSVSKVSKPDIAVRN